MDFNYGIEHEIAFLNAQGEFVDFSNIPFTDFEQIINDLPLYTSKYSANPLPRRIQYLYR
jgi:hypothetical protein